MYTTNVGTFRKMKLEEIKASLPILVTWDGAPLGIFSNPEDVITISDLDPTVRAQFKAREAYIRAAMAPPIYVAEVVPEPLA